LPEDIIDCLSAVKDVLAEGGSYYSTIHTLSEYFPDFFDGDIIKAYYRVSWMEENAKKLNLGFQSIGNTIIGQHMLRFYTL